MKRREFIMLFGGAAAAWPLAARAQQDQRLRRIGWLAGGLAANDPESRARAEAFVKALRELGWTEGHNIRIEYRWGAANVDNNRKQADELIALAPDAVLATASQSVHALQQASRCADRVRAGSRPGWRWLRWQLGATGRQRDRIRNLRVWDRCEMAGTAQGDRARREAGGRASGLHQSGR